MQQSKEEGKDQESIQSSTTPNPGYLALRSNCYNKFLKGYPLEAKTAPKN